MSEPLGTLEELPEDYRAAMTRAGVAPLWPMMRNVLPHDVPNPVTRSGHWSFESVRPLLMRDSLEGRPGGRTRVERETRMSDQRGNTKASARGLYTLAMVNTGIWALAIAALVFVIQRAPSAKGLYVILAGGTAVSIALVSRLRRLG